jgi:hypothetical protein
MCKHARAWTCRKAKAIGQKCEKPWENQGFAAERTGTELFDVFPMFFESSKGTIGVILAEKTNNEWQRLGSLFGFVDFSMLSKPSNISVLCMQLYLLEEFDHFGL